MPTFVQLFCFQGYPIDFKKENRAINVVLANLQKKNAKITSVALPEVDVLNRDENVWVITYEASAPIDIDFYATLNLE